MGVAGRDPFRMTEDASTIFSRKLAALIEEFKATVWREAFQAGGEAMRESIMRAAQTPVMPMGSPILDAKRVTSDANHLSLNTASREPIGPVKRAPRGSVGRALESVIGKYPGLAVTEIEERVLQLDREIARKSIGNELRRLEGKRYKRDRPGGYRWFLIDQAVGQEVGEPALTTPASDKSNRT